LEVINIKLKSTTDQKQLILHPCERGRRQRGARGLWSPLDFQTWYKNNR